MRYHQGERFGLSEEVQSYLYWFCRNFYRLTEKERQCVHETAQEVCHGGGLVPALLSAVTTDRSLICVAGLYYTSPSALQRLCREFYRHLAEKIIEKR